MNVARKLTIEPRLVDGRPMRIAGLAERYNGDNAGIPAQWQRFIPYIGAIPGQVDRAAYGVVFDSLKGAYSFGYLVGVEVDDVDKLPAGFGHLEIPAQRYAVFSHDGDVSDIPRTMRAIFGEWLPASRQQRAADGIDFFERYGEAFDPRIGRGGIEIWLPIQA